MLKGLLLTIAGFSVAPVFAGNIDVSPQLYFFNYRELDQDDRVINHEKGVLPGLSLGYESQWLETRLAYYEGRVAYRGETQSGSKHHTDTRQQLQQLGLRVTPPAVSTATSQLFIGYRYWHWQRTILTRNNVQGLHEVYSWQEVELGVKIKPKNQGSIGDLLELSLLYVIEPELSLSLPNSQARFRLGEKPGFRLRAGRSWQIWDEMRVALNLRVEYWRFGRSNTVATDDFFGRSSSLTEPASEALHSSIELKFNFGF